MTEPQPPVHSLSNQRKWLYQAGGVVQLIGLVLFLSFFLTFAMLFGQFGEDVPAKIGGSFFRAVVGMICMITGGIIRSIGSRGIAGSGMILDPERAKRDLEPFARMSGGLADASFSEMTTVRDTLNNLGGRGAEVPFEVVRVRCLNCQQLNEETARFCNQCGKPI